MKKLLTILLACSSLASTAFADCCEVKKAGSPSIKIGGKFEFGGVARSQDSLKDAKKRMSTGLDDAAFFSSAVLTGTVSGENQDLGLKYGATLGFTPLHSKARPNPSFLYVESLIGKFEFGAGKTVMTQMSIAGWDTSCGIGDLATGYASMDPNDYGISYVDSYSNYLDFSYRKKDVVEFSRKVSYITPRIFGLQAGISYIPDVSNNGSVSYKDDNVYSREAGIEEVYAAKKAGIKLDDEKDTTKDQRKINITHGVAGAVSYEYDISDATKVALYVGGEYAKAKDHQKLTPVPDDQKKADLFSWNIGGKITYQDLDVAGSYYNYGDSFSSKFQDGQEEAARKSYGFDVGVKYKIGNAAASLNYFHSDNKKNIWDTVSLGADYTLAPGLTPYVQAVKYAGVGKYKDVADAAIKEDKSPNGYLFIIGTRLKF
jgi:hypothetical protein